MDTPPPMPDLAPYIDMLNTLHSPEEAAHIMRSYGDVLSTLDLNVPVFDLSLLPHPKEEIRKAFVYGFIVAQDDAARKKHLQQGYVLLGRFQDLTPSATQIHASVIEETHCLSEEVVTWDVLIARMQKQQSTVPEQ